MRMRQEEVGDVVESEAAAAADGGAGGGEGDSAIFKLQIAMHINYVGYAEFLLNKTGVGAGGEDYFEESKPLVRKKSGRGGITTADGEGGEARKTSGKGETSPEKAETTKDIAMTGKTRITEGDNDLDNKSGEKRKKKGKKKGKGRKIGGKWGEEGNGEGGKSLGGGGLAKEDMEEEDALRDSKKRKKDVGNVD